MADKTLFPPPDEYDVQVKRTIPYYEDFINETIELLLSLDRPPELWLDTGCGTGKMVETALSRFPATRFLMADPSDKMLEQARKKLQGEGRVRFLDPVCSQDLGCVVTERPDVVTAIQCHHYLSKEERNRAVRGCFEVLIEGGTYVIFENIRPFTDSGVEIGKRYWGRFQRRNGKSQEEVDHHLARFDHEYFPITVEQHLDLLRNVGFSTVELFWYSYLQAGFYCIK
jgi:tRNA (cmo5U34)-methyltransferase